VSIKIVLGTIVGLVSQLVPFFMTNDIFFQSFYYVYNFFNIRVICTNNMFPII